jgi:DNA polymerase III alpha subunit (gram-positive type)
MIHLFKTLPVNRGPAQKLILAGHNIQAFDIPHLSDLFSRFKKDLSKFVFANNGHIVSIDTLKISTLLWSNIIQEGDEKMTLGACCDRAGIQLVDAHNAMADVRANSALIRYYRKCFQAGHKLVTGGASNLSGADVGSMQETLQADKIRHSKTTPFHF